jgi:hypothetical protein
VINGQSAYERIVDRLRALDRKVIARGPGGAIAQCPGPMHNNGDRNPSLSVSRGRGLALINCWAGCEPLDVMAALGLPMGDLFDNQSDMTWRYADGRQERKYYKGGKKKFEQPGTNNATTVLYTMAEPAEQLSLIEKTAAVGELVCLCEGPKDVDAIMTRFPGQVAVSAPQGAQSFHLVDATPLRGAQVIAIVDRDKTGEKVWVPQVVAKLEGVAKSLDFMQAKIGKDAADHINAGYTLAELAPWCPPEEVEPEPTSPDDPDQTAIDRRYLDLSARVLTLDGLRNLPAPAPLVGGYLFRDSLAWLGGKPGYAKTFVAVELACCVGTGTPWHGHTVAAGQVLYLIAEGASGITQRIDAWTLANGREADNVLYLPVPVQMMETVDVAAFGQLLADLRPILVVLDTQARVTVGAEENSSRDMGRFVDSLDQLRRHSAACILVVHHEPRNGENLRGSTALEGAATTILRVAKDGNVIELSNPKQKDAPEQASLLLALAPIGGSAILSHEAVGIAGFMTESEHHVLTVLRDSFGNRGATKTELRDATGQPNSTWYRSINALVGKGLVLEGREGRSTIYSLPSTDQQTVFP